MAIINMNRLQVQPILFFREKYIIPFQKLNYNLQTLVYSHCYFMGRGLHDLQATLECSSFSSQKQSLVYFWSQKYALQIQMVALYNILTLIFEQCFIRNFQSISLYCRQLPTLQPHRFLFLDFGSRQALQSCTRGITKLCLYEYGLKN